MSGPYDAINFSDLTQALADPDGDDLSNLQEYAVGADPHNSSDAQNGIVIGLTNSAGSKYATLQFKRRHNPDFPLQYIPEVSSDQQTWYSDSTHVVSLSVTSLDDQFD